MELRRWFQVFCILPALQDFVVLRVYSLQCPDTHYRTTDQKCCLKCRAGEMVKKDCKEQSNTTICKPCPENRYQDKPNGEKHCMRCRLQIKENRKLLKNCTRFHNQKYSDQCKDGFYLNRGLDYCKGCTRCEPGRGVKTECAKEADTKCEKCGMGTYSDQNSFTQKCMPCTPCKKGEEMYSECTPLKNYECRLKATTIPKTEILSTGTTRNTKTLQSNRPTDGGPTNASREDSRSWVMPFFVAAMVLLLILFVAFVIGVTVWCKIQSRNNLQNVIVQAEDPQILPRLTKLVDNADESVCLVNEESRFLYHQVPARKPAGGIRENGMMLRDVSHDIIETLANFLNPTSPPSNWRKVASMLDFPWNVINNLALCPTTATQQLLERWGTKRDATVYKLYLILKDIGRDDAAEVLERLLLQPVPSCPKSI